MKPKEETQSEILQIIGNSSSSGTRKILKRILVGAGLLVLIVALIFIYKKNESNPVQYRTQKVTRGTLLVTVTATGALEPTNQVEVGTELSGIVKSVEVDYNDPVEVNQILARLDTSKLEAQVMQSRAALESARAKVLEAQATVAETKSELDRLKHVRELSNNKVPSKHDLDAAAAALKRAHAAEAVANAQVSQAKATLEANETDMGKMVIRSPINGIVLSRSVEPGQTVAASFQTPVLFTLAEDLTNMELHVDVDEADVGSIRIDQEATFTVDAYPDKIFPARITQIRYAAETVDGVVTYETLLKVDNTDLFLRPGMTATASITVKKIENAVLVPNAALRFRPPSSHETVPSSKRGGFLRKLLPRPPRPTPRSQEEPVAGNRYRHVWTLQDGRLAPVGITTGSTDGNVTEVTGGDLAPGTAVVTDITGSVQ